MAALVLSLFLLSSACGQAAAGTQLVYATVLFRHGDRSPIRAYPTDPYQEDAWPQGFGQLSQEGMRQHLELGRYLRTRYSGFLNESYDRHEIMVRSTDVDRTLMSAEANLAGLYPPSGQQIFDPDLKWQPIPVHTVPLSEERLLSFPLNDCPRYMQLMNETKSSAPYIDIVNKYQDIMELVGNKAGLNSTTVASVWSIYDTLFCESCHNMSAPDWVTPDVLGSLKVLKNFDIEALFGVYNQQEKSRLQGGLLLSEIVKNLSKVAASDSSHHLKLMMLSAHDTTVAALQSSLNVFNGIQPPYASCQFIELYKDDNGSYSVSLFFRNDTSVAPYPQNIPGCAHDCPLEDFINITKLSIADDRDKECQVPSEGTNKSVLIALVLAISLLLLIIIFLLGVICWQKSPVSAHGYRHVNNQEVGEES